MPAIDIPDPLPPALIPPRTVIEFLIDQDLDEYGETGLVARTWHWVLHGGGPGRSAIWTGRSSTATGRRRPPPSPRKAPPTNCRCIRPARGRSSTRPGSSAGCALPLREGRFHGGSATGTVRLHLPGPRTGRSRSPCARSMTRDHPPRLVAAKAFYFQLAMIVRWWMGVRWLGIILQG